MAIFSLSDKWLFFGDKKFPLVKVDFLLGDNLFSLFCDNFYLFIFAAVFFNQIIITNPPFLLSLKFRRQKSEEIVAVDLSKHMVNLELLESEEVGSNI